MSTQTAVSYTHLSLSVYFDNAIIQSGSAKIKVDNSFGETNLYIPKEWKTENLSLIHI